MYQEVCSKIRVKQWPLTNTPEASLASETGELQEESSRTHNFFSTCSLNFATSSWASRFVYCAQKKLGQQRHGKSAAPSSPGFLYTVHLWQIVPYSNSSTSLKLQIVLVEEVYNSFEINAKESNKDKKSGLLTPVEQKVNVHVTMLQPERAPIIK